MGVETFDQHEAEIAGIDALDLPRLEEPHRFAGFWAAVWPKALAVVIALAAWQAVVWSGWKPEYALPGPVASFRALGDLLGTGEFWHAVAVTVRHAAVGYAIALVLGSLVGLMVSRSTILRSAVGSLITGLQSMPSIAWFPLAILLFQLSEAAIIFVVVIGAAPSIANGIITGVDHIPPLLLRAGKVLGARGLATYRHVIIPAALPVYVAGLKQGWAFAWRSLMAGELIVIITSQPSIGAGLQFARELSDAPMLIAWMIVVLAIGMIVDGVLFRTVESSIRRRRGLVEES